MKICRRNLFTGAAALLGIMALSPVQADMRGAGPVLLTVTGAVTNPNRGGYDPETDKFFGYNEVEFTAAREFDFEALDRLKNVTLKADFPKGRQVHEYEGPPFEDMIAQGAMVALKRDGVALGIGDFGPTQIVFPRAERADLKDMSDDYWVWSIFHINVK